MDDHAKQRSSSEGASDSSGQDHCSTLGHNSRSSNKGQIRHRASIACASCRERRIRCVVPEGSTECTQCKRSGSECIIRNDDERRRPISKAYMSSLSSRIALLESMLKERGVVPPPAVHPPKTRQEAQAQQQHQMSSQSFASGQQPSSDRDSSAPFLIKQEDCDVQEQFITNSFEPQEGDNTHSSFFQDGFPWKYPFYGPTACNHGYTSPLSIGVLHGPRDHDRRARKLIESLTTSTSEHLMSCFWDHYNTIHQVVNRQAFEADRRAQKPKSYSTFLHLAMLAAGYRFSDRSREPVKRFTLGNWESTLHRETRFLVESELERPGGMTTIQGMLILADLEFGAGRDTAGWIYSGIANRLAFAMGLQVQQNSTWDAMESGTDMKRLVMTACVLFDRHWALLLGRPTTIKNQDLGIKLLSKEHFSTHSVMSSPTIDELVHQRLVELMDLASKIADSQNTAYDTSTILATSEGDGNAYLQAVTLDQQLQGWYRRLPEELSWTPGNIKSAPFSFFMLHQQYHTCMILLYRPWAKYGPITLEGINAGYHPSPISQSSPPKDAYNHGLGSSGSVSNEGRVALARRMCTQHAVRVARIFWHHRQRGFDGTKISVIGIQHAGTSAIALMASLAHQSPDLDQRSNLSYLHVLSTAIYDLSRVYQPAARMYQLLKSILANIRAKLAPRPPILRTSGVQNMSQTMDFSGLSSSWQQGNNRRADNHFPVSVFQNNGNMTKLDETSVLEPPSKKRRIGPGSRRASEIAIPTSSFFKATDEQWYREALANGALHDASRLLSLGKHGRHYSHDDIELVGTSNSNSFDVSDGLDLSSSTYGYEFFADSSAVVDLIGQEKTVPGSEQQKGPEAASLPSDSIVCAAPSAMEMKPDSSKESDSTQQQHGLSDRSDESNDGQTQQQQSTTTGQAQSQQKSNNNHMEDVVSSDSIDATIEEWLAEPPRLTPTSLVHDAFSGSGSIDSPIQFEDSLPTIPESTSCQTTTVGPTTTATFAPSSPHAYNLLSDTLSVLTGGHQFQPDLLASTSSSTDTSTALHDGLPSSTSSSNEGQEGNGGQVDGELESWMAAAFGISSDGIDQMLSADSLNPSLCELVRSVERAVGVNTGSLGAPGSKAAASGGEGNTITVNVGANNNTMLGAGKDVLLKGFMEKSMTGMKRGCDEISGIGIGCGGVDASMKRNGLKALDYLEL